MDPWEAELTFWHMMPLTYILAHDVPNLLSGTSKANHQFDGIEASEEIYKISPWEAELTFWHGAKK